MAPTSRRGRTRSPAPSPPRRAAPGTPLHDVVSDFLRKHPQLQRSKSELLELAQSLAEELRREQQAPNEPPPSAPAAPAVSGRPARRGRAGAPEPAPEALSSPSRVSTRAASRAKPAAAAPSSSAPTAVPVAAPAHVAVPEHAHAHAEAGPSSSLRPRSARLARKTPEKRATKAIRVGEDEEEHANAPDGEHEEVDERGARDSAGLGADRWPHLRRARTILRTGAGREEPESAKRGAETDGEDPGEASRKRHRWQPAEDESLLEGIRRYGVGRWAQMRQDKTLQFRACRKPMDIKDRYRNLQKRGLA
eukprot:tig00020538_g10357.t1